MEFTITLPQGMDIPTQIANLKANCDTFSGDENSGSFVGKGVTGSYTIIGNIATVTLTDKPWYAPWSTVQSKITDYFKS